jgi:hypothetical protein
VKPQKPNDGRSAFRGQRFDRRSPGIAWIVGRGANATNALVLCTLHERSVRARLVSTANPAERVHEGDTRATPDGVDGGLWDLRRVEDRGTRILNPAASLPAFAAARRPPAPRALGSHV